MSFVKVQGAVMEVLLGVKQDVIASCWGDPKLQIFRVPEAGVCTRESGRSEYSRHVTLRDGR